MGHRVSVKDAIDNLSGRLDSMTREQEQEIIAMKDLNGENDLAGKYYQTGIDAIDDMTMGIFEGELIIIAARPREGKSALGLQIAKHISQSGAVLFISMEMPMMELRWRLLAAETGIDLWRIRGGKYDKRERDLMADKFREMTERYKGLYFIDNDSGLNSLMGKCRRFVGAHKAALIVFDYLQQLSIEQAETRNLQIATATRRMKQFAMAFRVPVVAISQLSRAIELRHNTTPQLSDLRDSGAIEQDANKIFFIHQDEKDRGTDAYQIIIAKDRNGRSGSVDVKFVKPFVRFESMHVSHTEARQDFIRFDDAKKFEGQ
jgi:replicative DNA helicase